MCSMFALVSFFVVKGADWLAGKRGAIGRYAAIGVVGMAVVALDRQNAFEKP